MRLYCCHTGELCRSDGSCVANTNGIIPSTDRCSTSRNVGQVRQLIVQQYLWPDHCVMNTTDAQFNARLIVKSTDIVVRKGYNCQVCNSSQGCTLTCSMDKPEWRCRCAVDTVSWITRLFPQRCFGIRPLFRKTASVYDIRVQKIRVSNSNVGIADLRNKLYFYSKNR